MTKDRSALGKVPLLLVISCMGGCTPGAPTQPYPSPGAAPLRVSTWWVEKDGVITSLQAPGQSGVGQPVRLSIRMLLGSSTCTKFGKVTAEVNEATKEVLVGATQLSLQSNGSLVCTADVVYASASVSFTPKEAGTYRVTARPFAADTSAREQGTSTSELEIVVK